MQYFKVKVTPKDGREKKEIHKIAESGYCFEPHFVPFAPEVDIPLRRGTFGVLNFDNDLDRCIQVSTSGVVKAEWDSDQSLHVETLNTYYDFTPTIEGA